jgi:hypothetical protein
MYLELNFTKGNQQVEKSLALWFASYIADTIKSRLAEIYPEAARAKFYYDDDFTIRLI